MAWELTLIGLYVSICQNCTLHLCGYIQRQSNNFQPSFSDEEILTIYLFGVMQKRFELRSIYDYTQNHLSHWFPGLPSYQAYVARLNRLSDVFPPLLEQLLKACPQDDLLREVRLLDSLPIIMANARRSGSAKVASEWANKGYCASKDMYFYGVKLHVLAFRQPGTLPFPDQVRLAPAAPHDLTIFREEWAATLQGGELYVDKAYGDEFLQEQLEQEQQLRVQVPAKKPKGATIVDAAAQLYGTAVSRVRQPIESFFNWLEQTTGIQRASKVRSLKGLLVHVFGRLAAAICVLIFNP
jgi:sRNA-binding carbon storage regulator CsrA